MTYLTQDEIATNSAMNARVAQATASEGNLQADTWTAIYRRTWSAAPGWDSAWESAKVSHEDDPHYDPGRDEAVITDQMILSQVQAMPDTLPEGTTP